MAKASIRDRLEKLENRRKFLDWFVMHRFIATLTLEELNTWVSGGGLPDPIPNRPSSLDTMDRKSLRRLWEENEQIFGGRSVEEREFFVDNGFWPEQRGRLHYFMQNGQLEIEWRSEVPEEDTPEQDPQSQSSSDSQNSDSEDEHDYHQKG